MNSGSLILQYSVPHSVCQTPITSVLFDKTNRRSVMISTCLSLIEAYVMNSSVSASSPRSVSLNTLKPYASAEEYGLTILSARRTRGGRRGPASRLVPATARTLFRVPEAKSTTPETGRVTTPISPFPTPWKLELSRSSRESTYLDESESSLLSSSFNRFRDDSCQSADDSHAQSLEPSGHSLTERLRFPVQILLSLLHIFIVERECGHSLSDSSSDSADCSSGSAHCMTEHWLDTESDTGGEFLEVIRW